MTDRGGTGKHGTAEDAQDAGGEPLRSVDAVRRRVPRIVERINADPALALRAAANPTFALEELGYTLHDKLRQELSLRIRFDEPTIARLNELEGRIYELTGETFDLTSPEALHGVLFERLQLPPLPPAPQRVVVAEGAVAQRGEPALARAEASPLSVPHHQPGGIRPPDPLEALRGVHPVIEPLLEYREIQARAPALASRAVYDRLASGALEHPALRIRAVLKRGPTPS